MKTSSVIAILTVLVVSIVILAACKRQPTVPAPPQGAVETSDAAAPEVVTAPEPRSPVVPPAIVTKREPVVVAPVSAPTPAAAPVTTPLLAPVYQQAYDTLLTPAATYEQRQQALNQLREGGKLDLVIPDLEQRAAANPKSPEFPAVLGQAYLQKAGSIKDLREQGILGMKADQTFDAALQLDPNNWEARFWKATAMSYWPPQLNKGREVVEHFISLVQLQESQPSQPQFVQTYITLGDQYGKQGYDAYSQQVWQRGLQYFPNDPTLLRKLSENGSLARSNGESR